MRRWMLGLLGAVLAFQLGCGTLLYPERHGRRSGRVDPGVLILDGVLLFLFVVPGLVAFAIDFYTGAVYLARADGTIAVARFAPGPITASGLEAILHEHTGRAIRLDEADLRRFRLRPGAPAGELLRALAAASFDPDAAAVRARLHPLPPPPA